jgi:hypothetical protein
LAVTLMRPLAASDAWDRAWPLDGSAFSVWALGPVSEGSTSDQPVVLYHRLQLPGTAAEDSVNAPTGANFSVTLGTPSPLGACRPLLAEAVTAAERGTPASGPAEAARIPVTTLSGVTVFNVTEGSEWRRKQLAACLHIFRTFASLLPPLTPHRLAPFICPPADNFNYPNPPGWGVSYHINGEESPVLAVVRGTTYTFNGGRRLARWLAWRRCGGAVLAWGRAWGRPGSLCMRCPGRYSNDSIALLPCCLWFRAVSLPLLALEPSPAGGCRVAALGRQCWLQPTLLDPCLTPPSPAQ